MQTIQCISAEDDTVHRAVQFVNTCMCSGLVGVRVPPPPPSLQRKVQWFPWDNPISAWPQGPQQELFSSRDMFS